MNDARTGNDSASTLIRRGAAVASERRIGRWAKAQADKGHHLAQRVKIIVGLSLIVSIALFFVIGWEFGLVAGFLLVLGAYVYASSPATAHKESNLALLLEKQAPVFGLRAIPGVPSAIARRKELLRGFDGVDDCQCGFTGSWRGVDIAMAEFHSPGDDEEATEWGLFISLSMKNPLTTPVIVAADAGFLGQLFGGRKTRVELDNTRFEQRYDVHSENTDSARGFLTDDLVKTILSAPRAVGEVPFELAFTDSQILIGYWSEADIIPVFYFHDKSPGDIKKIARRTSEILGLPHRLIEHFALA